MFWKPEHLLFRLKTTVLHNTYFLVEQNTVLYKNVAILWEFARLNIWDLEHTWVKRHQSRINNQNCKIVIKDVAKNNIKFMRTQFEQHRTTRIFNGSMQIIYLQTTPLTAVRGAKPRFSPEIICMEQDIWILLWMTSFLDWVTFVQVLTHSPCHVCRFSVFLNFREWFSPNPKCRV